MLLSSEAPAYFAQFGLENEVLMHIWDMCEQGIQGRNGKGYLARPEWIIANHLANQASFGGDMPPQLPAHWRDFMIHYVQPEKKPDSNLKDIGQNSFETNNERKASNGLQADNNQKNQNGNNTSVDKSQFPVPLTPPAPQKNNSDFEIKPREQDISQPQSNFHSEQSPEQRQKHTSYFNQSPQLSKSNSIEVEDYNKPQTEPSVVSKFLKNPSKNYQNGSLQTIDEKQGGDAFSNMDSDRSYTFNEPVSKTFQENSFNETSFTLNPPNDSYILDSSNNDTSNSRTFTSHTRQATLNTTGPSDFPTPNSSYQRNINKTSYDSVKQLIGDPRDILQSMQLLVSSFQQLQKETKLEQERYLAEMERLEQEKVLRLTEALSMVQKVVEALSSREELKKQVTGEVDGIAGIVTHLETQTNLKKLQEVVKGARPMQEKDLLADVNEDEDDDFFEENENEMTEDQEPHSKTKVAYNHQNNITTEMDEDNEEDFFIDND